MLGLFEKEPRAYIHLNMALCYNAVMKKFLDERRSLFASFGGAVFVCIILLLFYVWNWGSPLVMDDFRMDERLTLADDGSVFATGKTIQNFPEFVETFYLHRFWHYNGRMADVFAGLIHCFFGGKVVFNYLNTLACGIVMLWCAREYFSKISLYSLVVVCITLYVLLPAKWGTVLWLCGSCGYVGGTLFYLLFLWSIKQLNKEHDRQYFCMAAVLGFICGSWHEGLGLPLLSAVVSLWVYIFCRYNRNSKSLLCISAFIVAGLLIPMTAPAIWIRSQQLVAHKSIWVTLWYMVGAFCRYSWLSLLVVGGSLILRRRACKVSVNFFFLIYSGGLAFITALGGGMGRGFYFFCLASAVFLWEMLPLIKCKWERVIGVTGALLCLVIMAQNARQSYHQRLFFEEILQRPTDSGGCILYQSKGDDDPCLSYYYSLSPEPNDALRSYVSKKYKRESFWYYVRRSQRDVTCYKTIAALPEDGQCHVDVLDDGYAIRLPWLYVLPEAEIVCTKTTDGKELWMRNHRVGWSMWREIQARHQNVELAEVEFDYYEGHYYIIIPKDLIITDKVSFSAVEHKKKPPIEFFVTLPKNL